MKKNLLDFCKIAIGCILFGVGFNWFLEPCGLNAGGLSGLAMVAHHLWPVAPIGVLTAVMNLPLFAFGGIKIGKRFFFGSLVGMILTSASIDLFSFLPGFETETLLSAVYGGLICGFGLGLVFSTGGSTGGSDIIVRLLKLRYQNVPIGIINICFDMCVAVLTGIVFGDFKLALYSGVSIFVCGRVIDAVVYRFDYSKVVIIISQHHRRLADQISDKLKRGATFLDGSGAYSGAETKVILTVVKKQQISDLKQLVVEIDPDAFIIVQEAHQVLGDGFSRYSKYSL